MCVNTSLLLSLCKTKNSVEFFRFYFYRITVVLCVTAVKSELCRRFPSFSNSTLYSFDLSSLLVTDKSFWNNFSVFQVFRVHIVLSPGVFVGFVSFFIKFFFSFFKCFSLFRCVYIVQVFDVNKLIAHATIEINDTVILCRLPIIINEANKNKTKCCLHWSNVLHFWNIL